jgi:hypothetical protein
MLKRIVIVLSGVAVFAARAECQTELQRSAAAAWNARDWNKVLESYRTIAATDTTQFLPHIRMGAALTALGRYAEAKKELVLSERKGAPVPQAAFRLALAEAGAGRLDSAFAQLDRATSAGMIILPVPGDSMAPMQAIKGDSRYAKFLTNVDRNARPCNYDEKFKEFDFWLGSWDVRPKSAPLNPPARSEITKTNEGCVVHESWHGVGNIGESYNIYDRTRQKWFQYWVDNFGGLHEYTGSYSDNAMRYEGTTPAGPGTPGRVQTRLTFFRIAADTVRQFSESLQADGTWTANYDFIYIRRK